jgi:hypothetical protein
MNTTGRILSIIVFMAVATTALTFGTSTTFAATNGHQNGMIADINGDNSNSTAGNYYSRSPTAYEFAQYAWSHPHHHHNSADQNDIVATNGANPTNTADSTDSSSFSPTQYGSGSHPHHHHSSTHMIADINGDNSNSTAGSYNSGSFSPTQYGSGSHPHHHHSLTDQNGIFSGSSDAGWGW